RRRRPCAARRRPSSPRDTFAALSAQPRAQFPASVKIGGTPKVSETDRGGGAVGPDLVLAVFGPTASGKSAVAEAVAERMPAELISADSAQVYRRLPILTNQPHEGTRLVAIWDLGHEASVGEYQALAHREIDRALAA